MTCIKMGSDESHFNVSLIVRDKVTRQCPQTTTFEEKGELKEYRTNRCPSAYQPITARPNPLPWLFCFYFIFIVKTSCSQLTEMGHVNNWYHIFCLKTNSYLTLFFY